MDTRGIAFHGAVLHTDVPQWMAAADVLVCPHRVDEFTLSLDAIKSFEYIASGRPVVATPTSGFQSFARYEGVHVIEPTRYIDALYALGRQRLPTIARRGCEHDWSIRAREFATQLSLAESPPCLEHCAASCGADAAGIRALVRESTLACRRVWISLRYQTRPGDRDAPRWGGQVSATGASLTVT